jgi:hypothetical protein
MNAKDTKVDHSNLNHNRLLTKANQNLLYCEFEEIQREYVEQAARLVEESILSKFHPSMFDAKLTIP